MKYNLFLDDERRPEDVTWINPKEGSPGYDSNPLWWTVRNYKDFVRVITKHGLPSCVSFDHDIDQAHYPWNNPQGIPQYGKYKELTGYEAAKWMCQYAADHPEQTFPVWDVHSHNPIGKENIINYITNFLKSRHDSGKLAQPLVPKTGVLVGSNPTAATNSNG